MYISRNHSHCHARDMQHRCGWEVGREGKGYMNEQPMQSVGRSVGWCLLIHSFFPSSTSSRPFLPSRTPNCPSVMTSWASFSLQPMPPPLPPRMPRQADRVNGPQPGRQAGPKRNYITLSGLALDFMATRIYFTAELKAISLLLFHTYTPRLLSDSDLRLMHGIYLGFNSRTAVQL
jgi:hypothetical protein